MIGVMSFSNTTQSNTTKVKDGSKSTTIPRLLFECKICDLRVCSQIDLNAHLNGKKHKENSFCKHCDLKYTSKVMKNSHLSGKKHQDKIKAMDDNNLTTLHPLFSHD